MTREPRSERRHPPPSASGAITYGRLEDEVHECAAQIPILPERVAAVGKTMRVEVELVL